jgi:hypothetical protein
MKNLFDFIFSPNGQLIIFIIDLILIYQYAHFEFIDKLKEEKKKKRKVPIIDIMPNPIFLLIIIGLSYIPIIQLIIMFLLFFYLLAVWEI